MPNTLHYRGAFRPLSRMVGLLTTVPTLLGCLEQLDLSSLRPLLWEHLENASHLNVFRFFDIWQAREAW